MWYPLFLRADPAAVKGSFVNYKGTDEIEKLIQAYSTMLGSKSTGWFWFWFWQVNSLSTK